jgi:transcriptional regulator with XRE-family HTH domain
VLAVVEEAAETWEAALAKSVGRRVAQFRKQRGLTAQQLSVRLRDRVGLDLKRTVIGNLESGYRRTISYAEILALAHVLEVPPLLLMVPIGTDDFQPLPGGTEEPWWSAMWITGEGLPPACEEPPPEMVDRYRGHLDYLGLYRQHTDVIGQWTRAAPARPRGRPRPHARGREGDRARSRLHSRPRRRAAPATPSSAEHRPPQCDPPRSGGGGCLRSRRSRSRTGAGATSTSGRGPDARDPQDRPE